MKWHSTLATRPPDLATVWIRRWPYFDRPRLAQWILTTQDFSFTDSDGVYLLPWYNVHSWRSQ